MRKSSRGGVVCSGRDLVQALPAAVAAHDDLYVFAAIPANPCYWLGTRIAAIAAAHQNYRPLQFKVTYVPQVAVTTPGTVLVGTNWGTLSSVSNFQQSLVTSNGGAMSQCYTPFSTSVKCGASLQQNLFNCAGPMDTDHNPFTFLAYMRGSAVIPGYFYVTYTYVLKNPIGYAINYGVNQVVAPDYGLPTPDRALVLLNSIPTFSGPGVTLDLESDGTTMYNGTPIAVPNGTNAMCYTCAAAQAPVEAEIRSVAVSDQHIADGDTILSAANFSAWNWDTDVNESRGTYDTGAGVGWGWYYHRALGQLRGWADSAATNAMNYVYSIDWNSKNVKRLISAGRLIAGSNVIPTLLLDVADRFVDRKTVDAATIQDMIRKEIRAQLPVQRGPMDDDSESDELDDPPLACSSKTRRKNKQ